MRDDLPHTGARKRERGVVNLDSSAGKGTHWVAYDASPHKLLYFDSYGLPPPIEMVHYLRKGHPTAPLQYNSWPIQNSNDGPICGHLSMHVLRHLALGKPFLKILLALRRR